MLNLPVYGLAILPIIGHLGAPGISCGRADRGSDAFFRVSSRYQSAGGDDLSATWLPGGHTRVHRHSERSISQPERHRRLLGLGGVHRSNLLLPGDGEPRTTIIRIKVLAR